MCIESSPVKVILQCVNELYELIPTSGWEENEQHINRLVFIGKGGEYIVLTVSLLLLLFCRSQFG